MSETNRRTSVAGVLNGEQMQRSESLFSVRFFQMGDVLLALLRHPVRDPSCRCSSEPQIPNRAERANEIAAIARLCTCTCTCTRTFEPLCCPRISDAGAITVFTEANLALDGSGSNNGNGNGSS